MLIIQQAQLRRKTQQQKVHSAQGRPLDYVRETSIYLAN